MLDTHAECFIQNRGIVLTANSDAIFSRAGYSYEYLENGNTLYCIEGKGVFYNTSITGCIPIPYNTSYAQVYKYHGYVVVSSHHPNEGYVYTCRTYNSYSNSPSNPNSVSYGSSSNNNASSEQPRRRLYESTYYRPLWYLIVFICLILSESRDKGCLFSIILFIFYAIAGYVIVV